MTKTQRQIQAHLIAQAGAGASSAELLAIAQGGAFEMPAASTPASTPVDPAASQLTGHDRQRAFITAGKAIFTIEGSSSRYTFKISHKAASEAYAETYFVSMLTGPDNLADYTYVGLLEITTGMIRLTRKSQYTADSKNVKAFNWTIGRIWQGKSIDPAKIWHIGRCGRCGRALTVPASIEAGIGPECSGKLAG